MVGFPKDGHIFQVQDLTRFTEMPHKGIGACIEIDIYSKDLLC